MPVSAARRHDPRAAHERRLVPHVLAVAAGEISHPIAMLVLMKADNGLLHPFRLPKRRRTPIESGSD